MSAPVRTGIGGSRLLSPAEWAAWWDVSRETARARLAALRRRYGAAVVHRVGKQRVYMASMEAVEALRIVENDPPITQEQFTKAMGEVWRKLREIESKVA